MSWRDELRQASFRGVAFKVAVNSKTGGRRGVTYEFPKRDDTLDEDMGRRVRRRNVSAYVIGPDYDAQAEELEAALDREGAGLLILPVMGQATMRCEAFTRGERKEEGGFAVFEMTFVAAGNAGFSLFGSDTQNAVQNQATVLSDSADLSAGNDSNWVS